MSRFVYEYPRPALTADMVVFGVNKKFKTSILLIERRHDPFAGRWVLPGGFVESNETLEAGARRELREETSLVVNQVWPLAPFGNPGRDPRGWTVTAPFYSVVWQEQAKVAGGDDARKANWHPISKLPPLAFDHADIVKHATETLVQQVLAKPVVASLFPETDVKIVDLIKVYSALGVTLKRAALLSRLLENKVIKKVPRSTSLVRFVV